MLDALAKMVSCFTLTQIMITGVLKMLVLLSCWILTGVVAEEPPVVHYLLKHSDVCLHVGKPPPYDNAEWTFAKKILTVGKKLHPSYTDKMTFTPENLTLCIKKLTEIDSGIYEASFVLSNFEKVFITHQVIVQDAVPKPVMTVMSEHRSNLSAASCRVTVNCSIQDQWLWSVCDEDGCIESQRSFSELNITINHDNTTIFCGGKNHVSTNNVSENIATKCFMESSHQDKEEPKPGSYVVITIISVFFFIICAIFIITLFLKACRQKEFQPTSAALVISSGPLETQPSEPRASTSSSSSEAEPSYENVDSPQLRDSVPPAEEQGYEESQRAETVYSTARAASCLKHEIREDTTGQKDEQKTSESPDQVRDQSLPHIDTVYTELQMPKKLKSQHHQEAEKGEQKANLKPAL